MNRGLLRFVFVVSLNVLTVSFLNAAVFQELVDQNPDTYKTHILFTENIPSGAQLPASKDLKAPEKILPLTEPNQTFFIQSIISPVIVSPGSSKMSAHYERATLESVERIIRRYKSIPGGVTLEGVAKGLPKIQTIDYAPEKNIFILNDGILYQNPLSKGQMREILSAIQSDDLMGVSLGDKDIIYGALPEGSLGSINLKLTDHFLGCIIFANNRWVSFHSFPDGYRPRTNMRSGTLFGVYFNFCNFTFEVKDNEIKSSGSHLTITLIPLTSQQDSLGGYLPDYVRIVQGLMPKEYEDNITHVVKNISFYQNEGRIERANRYGEAAAFARAVRESGASINDLIKKM